MLIRQVLVPIARELIGRGYDLVATRGTAVFLEENLIKCESVNKVLEGRPHVVDLIKNDEITFIVNTTEGAQAISDSFSIRREALAAQGKLYNNHRRRAGHFARPGSRE